uniref:Plastid-encoded RNA polymerase subunit alpha n=1 Tax=Pseudobryopsis hainanensis TaxID=2320808 RepID=A0A3S5X1K1_9CHLO|nr:RNA polymerase a-subunit [Pseudobryopsis hainanensis]
MFMKTTVFACLDSRIETNNQFYGMFKLGPFSCHQGLTIANAIRRTALDCGLGVSILAVQVDGARHEYVSLKGLRECVFDILSNLRCVALQSHTTQRHTCVAHANLVGPGVFRARHLRLPKSFKCVNPNQSLASLDVDGQVRLKMFLVPNGATYLKTRTAASVTRAYDLRWFSTRRIDLASRPSLPVPLADKKFQGLKPFNYLYLGHPLNPVIRVNYAIEPESDTHHEFIRIEVWTNGSCHPRTVVQKSIQSLLAYLIPFYPTRFSSLSGSSKKGLNRTMRRVFDRRFFGLDIDNLNLPFPIWQFLKGRNLSTLRDVWVYLKTTTDPLPTEVTRTLTKALEQYGLKFTGL